MISYRLTMVCCTLFTFGLIVASSARAVWTGEPPLANPYSEHEFLAACRENNINAVRYYLGLDGFDCNKRFHSSRSRQYVTGLYLVSSLGHCQIAKALIDAGADVNQACNDITPLLIACLNNQQTVVRLLIAETANVNQPCRGITPLHVASERGGDAIVNALLEAGADIDRACQHRHQFTPLYLASKNGHHGVVGMLLAQRANANKPCHGLTPLHAASYHGHNEAVSLLIANGANVNRACYGVTPLYIASQKGYEGVVATLLKAGADPTIARQHHRIFATSPRATAKHNRPCLRICNRDKYDRYSRIIRQLDDALAARPRPQHAPMQLVTVHSPISKRSRESDSSPPPFKQTWTPTPPLTPETRSLHQATGGK